MLQWDSSQFSVTPAASLLSRCVSIEVLSQEEIDSASCRLSPSFSSRLHEAEQRIRAQRQLDQLQLQTELLETDQRSADVTHTFHLTRRFQVLQVFCGHLQNLLKDQNSLRQRLLRPLGRTNLTVQAHLHRCVVELVTLLLDFIETLEEKMDSVRCRPAARERLAQLNTSVARLLAHVGEVESLSNRVLQRDGFSRGTGSPEERVLQRTGFSRGPGSPEEQVLQRNRFSRGTGSPEGRVLQRDGFSRGTGSPEEQVPHSSAG